VRCLEQHDGALFSAQLAQPCPPLGWFGWQKSLKAEPSRRQAAADQGGGSGTGPGDADHRTPIVAGGCHKVFAGIGDAWQARIADHGDSLAGRQSRQQLRDAAALVVLMKAHQPCDPIALAQSQLVQQQPTAAGVLTGDQVDPRQHMPGPGGKVAQITDRGSHQIQHPGGGFGLLHNAPIGATPPVLFP